MTQVAETAPDSAFDISPAVRRLLDEPPRLFIGGEWVTPRRNTTLEVRDPATGQIVTTVGSATADDVDAAARAAARAFDHSAPWRTMSALDRGRLIDRLADALEEHAEEFAEIEVLDGGKTRQAALDVDVPLSIKHFRYFAGWPSKIEGATVPVSVPDMMVHTHREPVGVVGQIIPWNYPLLMAAWKLAPALAAGATTILKPAENTPLAALRLAEIIDEVGFPPGVVNVVPGLGPEAGNALVEHPLVDKIAFTGSTRVGTAIAAKAAAQVKRVTLELGGKSPNIVFADAPIAEATAGASSAIFFNAGQACSAGSRLYVERRAFDSVVAGLAELAENMRIGHGLRSETDLGPVISQVQRDRVAGYVDEAVSAGARVVTGGSDFPANVPTGGYFHKPTVLIDVDDQMPAVREEIFGPVVVAQPFDDLDEIARRGNDSPYGLAAGVWTRDIGRANRLAKLLRSGTVYINTYGNTDAAAPFGGFKRSGYGREMGHDNLEAYLETKTVWTSLT